jgi:hypothetical protein
LRQQASTRFQPRLGLFLGVLVGWSATRPQPQFWVTSALPVILPRSRPTGGDSPRTSTLGHYTARYGTKRVATRYCIRHRDRACDNGNVSTTSIRGPVCPRRGLRTDLDAGEIVGGAVSRQRNREPRVSLAITCTRFDHSERHYILPIARKNDLSTSSFRLDGDTTGF